MKKISTIPPPPTFSKTKPKKSHEEQKDLMKKISSSSCNVFKSSHILKENKFSNLISLALLKMFWIFSLMLIAQLNPDDWTMLTCLCSVASGKVAEITVIDMICGDKYNIWCSYNLIDQTMPLASSLGVPAVFFPALLFKSYNWGKMSFGGCVLILKLR